MTGEPSDQMGSKLEGNKQQPLSIKMAVETQKSETITQITSYHPQLDVPCLEEMYGRDWDFASDMFLTFLEEIAPDFDQLNPLVQQEDWERFYQVAHKVKPSLGMVGLTTLQQKVMQAELIAKQNPEKNKLAELTENILKDLKIYLPIIQQQYRFFQQKAVGL